MSYGFFSKRRFIERNRGCVYVYATPDGSGEVRVTHTSESPDPRKSDLYFSADSVPLGEVGVFLYQDTKGVLDRGGPSDEAVLAAVAGWSLDHGWSLGLPQPEVRRSP